MRIGGVGCTGSEYLGQMQKPLRDIQAIRRLLMMCTQEAGTRVASNTADNTSFAQWTEGDDLRFDPVYAYNLCYKVLVLIENVMTLPPFMEWEPVSMIDTYELVARVCNAVLRRVVERMSRGTVDARYETLPSSATKGRRGW